MKQLLLILGLIGLLITGCNDNKDTLIPSPTPTQGPTSVVEISPTPTEVPTLTEEPIVTPSPTSTPTPSPELLEVHFIDVGQGDAILIDLAEMEVLIDGGGRSPGVAEYLRNYVDGALELMVATHPHADHIGGLIEVLEEYEVDHVWHNQDSSTSKTYAEFMRAVESEGADMPFEGPSGEYAVENPSEAENDVTLISHKVYRMWTDQSSHFDLRLLHPTELHGSTNNNSMVLHLSYGEIDFLFTGDAEIEAEAEMIERGSVPDIDVLKVGHHGSRTASSLDFLQITSPRVAIYMCGEGNSYGHPHEETITNLNAIGAEIYGTDVYGTIVVSTDGDDYMVEVEEAS